MRIIRAGQVLITALALGTLTACGSSDVAVDEPQGMTSYYEKEQEFLMLARLETSLETIEDMTLLEAGWGMCDDLGNGVTANEILRRGALVFTTYEGKRGFASVLAAAVVSLCPEYADTVKSQYG